MSELTDITRRGVMLASAAAGTGAALGGAQPAGAQPASPVTMPFGPGVRAGVFAFASADGRGPDGSLGGARDAAAQAGRSLDHLRNNLRALGQDLDQVVSLWVLLTNYADLDAVVRVVNERFPDPSPVPALTVLGISGLDGDCLVRLDAIASSASDRRPIAAPAVPLARGARVHGVFAGGLAFLSGIDAGDVTGASAAETMGRQTTTVLDRIDAVLRTQNLSLADVGRTFMFMTDLRVRTAYGAARAERYKGVFEPDKFPANSGIGIPNLGANAMLRSVAIAGSGKSYVVSDRVRLSPGSFSQAVRYGDWMFIAGIDAIDMQRRTEHIGNLKGQTERTLEYTRYIVEAAGATMDDIVKTTCYLIAGQDRSHFADTYRRYFEAHTRGRWLPNGVTLDVQELAADVLVEIDSVVYLGRR
jgi:2-iminobutanoate/2-iminopropanoate deaminase